MIFLLENVIQDYEWGSKSFLQDLLGNGRYEGKPAAELWMGTHPRGPSKVLVNGEPVHLSRIIREHPEAILGKEVARRFSGQLPFLFKVLAAERPLSVQVHPDLDQAKEGYERENAQGIPENALERNYKDPNHKPELLCALSPFEGLKGFRSEEEILSILNRLSSRALLEEAKPLMDPGGASGLKSFYGSLMAMKGGRKEELLNEAISKAREQSSAPVFSWVVELHRQYPGDMGALSPLFLNLVRLAPGEAMYLGPGELHSYLKGAGIELMANSDNVLRGGLTRKHVDLEELLKIVRFEGEYPQKIEPVASGPYEAVYKTPAEEFLLSVIELSGDGAYTSASDRAVEILISVKGQAHIEEAGAGRVIDLPKGRSVLVPASVIQYRIEGRATIYKATVPR